MRILGLDPGGTTGWAYWADGVFVEHGVIENGLDGFLEWDEQGYLTTADMVVIEDFVVEPGFVGRPDASEIIGAVRGLSDLIGIPVYRQLRSQKATLIKGTETERFNWLRERGFYGMTHELDAVTHVLIRLKNMGDRETIQEYWL